MSFMFKARNAILAAKSDWKYPVGTRPLEISEGLSLYGLRVRLFLRSPLDRP